MIQHPNGSVSPSDWRSFELLQGMIDALDTPIFVKDLQHRWIACNQAFCMLMGNTYDDIIGRSDPDYFPPEQVDVFWRLDDQVTGAGQPHSNEEQFTDAGGIVHTLWTRKFPTRDATGKITGLCGIITDITELKRRQEQVALLESEVATTKQLIDQQNSMLDELAVPVIQVWESILLLPLVGLIDGRRATQVMESMLESISRASAEVVILDISGVPVVDTSVASYLVRAVQAAQLLGCQSILVGISAEIAQTLVVLGVDFSHITIRASLQGGLEYALKRLDYAVVHHKRRAA